MNGRSILGPFCNGLLLAERYDPVVISVLLVILSFLFDCPTVTNADAGYNCLAFFLFKTNDKKS